VVGEVLKSWWHRMQSPQLYYYRDRDGKEIDLLIRKDDKLYPIEIKKSATPSGEWTKNFDGFNRFGRSVGDGAVICLGPQTLPLRRRIWAVPAGLI
jgi:predicted AAA+ superfamily ATPase